MNVIGEMLPITYIELQNLNYKFEIKLNVIPVFAVIIL